MESQIWACLVTITGLSILLASGGQGDSTIAVALETGGQGIFIQVPSPASGMLRWPTSMFIYAYIHPPSWLITCDGGFLDSTACPLFIAGSSYREYSTSFLGSCLFSESQDKLENVCFIALLRWNTGLSMRDHMCILPQL